MKRPQKHTGIKVAEKVLAAINVPHDVAAFFDVVGYENGREHGFCIRGFGLTNIYICFAEYRRNDDIVVYVSHCTFLADGNIPAEDAELKFFPNGQYQKAAQFIEKQLKTFAIKKAA